MNLFLVVDAEHSEEKLQVCGHGVAGEPLGFEDDEDVGVVRHEVGDFGFFRPKQAHQRPQVDLEKIEPDCEQEITTVTESIGKLCLVIICHLP